MEINDFYSPIDIQGILIHLRQAGFTGNEIAAYIGTNQSTVCRMLSGKVRRPRGQAIKKLQQMKSQYLTTI